MKKTSYAPRFYSKISECLGPGVCSKWNHFIHRHNDLPPQGFTPLCTITLLKEYVNRLEKTYYIQGVKAKIVRLNNSRCASLLLHLVVIFPFILGFWNKIWWLMPDKCFSWCCYMIRNWRYLIKLKFFWKFMAAHNFV